MSGRNNQKYGQHFLIAPQIITQIVDAAQVLRAQQLVEIGPGKGALTQALLQHGNTGFTVVEIDPDMVSFLQQNLPSAAVNIVQADFLQFDLHTLPAVPTQFVSNLPYIDAARILDKVLSWPYFQTAVFMFQKEQAQKITARPGEKGYGALSVLSQLRAQISLICNVGRGCFNPPPQVDSRVLAFEKITTPAHWSGVERVVQTAFLHRRKTLSNALVLGRYEKESITAACTQLNLTPSVRPEELSPQQFVELARLI